MPAPLITRLYIAFKAAPVKLYPFTLDPVPGLGFTKKIFNYFSSKLHHASINKNILNILKHKLCVIYVCPIFLRPAYIAPCEECKNLAQIIPVRRTFFCMYVTLDSSNSGTPDR